MASRHYPVKIGFAALVVMVASLALADDISRHVRSDYKGADAHVGRRINGSFDHNVVSEEAVRALEQRHCRELNRQQGDQLQSFRVYRTETDGWFDYRAICR